MMDTGFTGFLMMSGAPLMNTALSRSHERRRAGKKLRRA
jgi:hypothetical protein